MMRTEDCVKAWIGAVCSGDLGYCGRASSCHASGDKFVSYSTPVCRFREGAFELATKKYSVTTSKLQGYLRRNIPTGMLKEVETVTR